MSDIFSDPNVTLAQQLAVLVQEGICPEATAMDLLAQEDYFELHRAEFNTTYPNKYVLVVDHTVFADDVEDNVKQAAQTQFPDRPGYMEHISDEPWKGAEILHLGCAQKKGNE